METRLVTIDIYGSAKILNRWFERGFMPACKERIVKSSKLIGTIVIGKPLNQRIHVGLRPGARRCCFLGLYCTAVYELRRIGKIGLHYTFKVFERLRILTPRML